VGADPGLPEGALNVVPADREVSECLVRHPGVDNGMRIAQEEIFGPVLSVIRYTDEAEAIRIANDSIYGLNGGVWTSDVDHGLDIARQVRTGGFHVNGAPRDGSAPFGGVKASGIGRENGVAGLEYKSTGF
jgi:betaine-aldehyde dehydrogenase